MVCMSLSCYVQHSHSLLISIFAETRLKKLETIPAEQRTIAAHGFISLLTRLRRVLLQDCAFLQQKYPNHLLLQHELFRSDLYKAYAERVLQTASTAVAPMDVQFRQVMPHLHSKMDTISGIMEVGIKDLQLTVDQSVSGFRQEMEPILQDLGAVQQKQARDQKIIAGALGVMADSMKMFSEGTFETRFRPSNHPPTELDSSLSPPVTEGMTGGMLASFEKSLSQVTQTTHQLLNPTQQDFPSMTGPNLSPLPTNNASPVTPELHPRRRYS